MLQRCHSCNAIEGPESQLSWLCRYLLVTPMVSEQWGTAALIIRGWVPDTWRSDPAAREPYQPAGQVSLECDMAALAEPGPCTQAGGMAGIADMACNIHTGLQAVRVQFWTQHPMPAVWSSTT